MAAINTKSTTATEKTAASTEKTLTEKAVETVKPAAAKAAPEVKKTAQAVKPAAEKAAAPVKPAAKAAAAVKSTAKKTASKAKSAAKKTAAKAKASVAKAKVKAASIKEEATSKVYLQYAGNEILAKDVLEKVKEAYVAEGHRASGIKSVQVYLKPEENAAYYVINNTAGRIDLF